MINENIKLNGWVNIKHIRNGKVINERDNHNLIQTVGKNTVAQYLTGEYTGNFGYIGIGILGTGGDNAALTALVSEVKEDGTAGVIHKVCSSKSATTNVATMICTFNMTGGAAVTEVGLFSTTPAGVMLARQTFAALNLVSSDSLQICWLISIS